MVTVSVLAGVRMDPDNAEKPQARSVLPKKPSFCEKSQPPSGSIYTRGVFLGSIRGIRLYLDYSWFLIAALVIYALSTAAFPLLLKGRESIVYLAMGTVAAALFFISILLHELGHSIVSQRCGIPVPRITLLFIGGIAEISREPEDPWTELKIAAAGPAVSLVLVAVYQLASLLFEWVQFWEAHLIFRWLAAVNLALVIFNSIPGYPLDGGRILRALLWMHSGKLRQATYVASRVGILFSWVLIGLGVYGLLAYQAWNAIILILVGVFLKSAAEAGYSQVVYREALSGLSVKNVMTPNAVLIPEHLPLNLAVDDFFLTHHHVAFPVIDEAGGFKGLLQLESLSAVSKQKWPFTSVSETIPSGEADALCIHANEQAENALRKLTPAGHGRLAVVDERNKVVGIITRHDLLEFIKIHTEIANAK